MTSRLNSGSVGAFDTGSGGVELLLEKAHAAIPFSCVIIEDSKRGGVLVSGGFDSKLLFTSLKEQRVYKEVCLKETIAATAGILKTGMTQPFVYNISRHPSAGKWLVGLETGNVLEFKGVNKNKPSSCFEGHTTRVIKTEYYEKDLSIVLTVSDDLSWALWDSKTTDLIKKVAIGAKPNWVESMADGKIVVSDVEGNLNFYEIKD